MNPIKKVKNYLQSFQGEVEIGTEWVSNVGTEVYAGPQFGWVTPEKYNEYLKDGSVSRGEQTVQKLFGDSIERVSDISSNVSKTWEQTVGHRIPDIPGPNEKIKGALSTTKNVAGNLYNWTIRENVDHLLTIADIPLQTVHHTSKFLDPTGRGWGKSPITIAELLLTLGGGAIKKGGKTLLTQGDEVVEGITKSLSKRQLQPVGVGVGTDLGNITTKIDDINPNVMATTTRNQGSVVLGGQTKEARRHYEKLKLKRNLDDRVIASTSTHHMNQLVQQADAVISHPKGDNILKNLKAKNIPVGDDIRNYTSIVDWNSNALRSERVKYSQKLYPNIPRKTFDDAFGASDFKPPELSIAERTKLKKLKSQTDITTEEFFDSLGRRGSYPSIDLFKPDGTKITWRAKTGKEWDDRWKVINKHYGSNIDPKKLYNIKIDPELATYAPDHGYLHKEILDNLPSHKRLKELQKSGEWKTLSEGEATKLLIQVSKDSFKMSHGISKWRYGQIAEYYEKMKLNSKVLGNFKNKKWNQLPTNIQQEYFKENASKLSSYGSRTIPSMDELLTSTKKLTQKEKNFYGIK